MMIDRPKTLPVTDLMVTPEGISWSVGPIFFTFNVQGHLEAHLIEDGLPEGDTAKKRLSVYASHILVAAISAGRAEIHTPVLRGAILQMQALCETHGVGWENDPDALERAEELLPASVLKSVELALS